MKAGMGISKLLRTQGSGLSERLGEAARANLAAQAPAVESPPPPATGAPATSFPPPAGTAAAGAPPAPPPVAPGHVAVPPPVPSQPEHARHDIGWTDVDAPASGTGTGTGTGTHGILAGLGDIPLPHIPGGGIVAIATMEGDQAKLLEIYDDYYREHPRPPVGLVLHFCLPVKEGIMLIDVWRSQQFLDSWMQQGGGGANPKTAKIHAVRTGA
jgi:hypothetical protein